MNAFAQHFSFEFRTGIRNRSLLFMTYIFPLAVYAILGSLMTAVNPLFKEAMIPAMVLFAVMASALLSMPDPLVTARNAGILRSYRITGVPAFSVLIIPALSALLHLILLAVLITASAPVFFDAPLPVSWLGFGVVFVISVFAFAGIGLLVGVVSGTSQMTILWVQAIFLPSMILGGLMMPLNFLPPMLSRIAYLLPTTYAMTAFRGLAMGLPVDFDARVAAVILLAGALLAFGLAYALFTWDSNDSRRQKRAPLGLLVMLPYVVGMILRG